MKNETTDHVVGKKAEGKESNYENYVANICHLYNVGLYINN